MIEHGAPSKTEILRSAPETAGKVKEAAVGFLGALTSEQRSRAVFDFKDDEFFFWHYTPIERQGLPLKEMDQRQRDLAYSLIGSGLSTEAFGQVQAIIQHELILGALERDAGTVRWDRDPGLYFFSVFGDPSAKDPWGCRIEGHHVSLHFTVVGDQLLAVTPSFFGANPAWVPSGPKEGLRILAVVEDLARELARSLDRQQTARALIDETAPADIITTNSRQVVMEKMEGLPAADMTSAQRETLMRLVGTYIGRKSPEVAQRELHNLKTRGIERLHFAWAGSLELGQGHYYRIHGPAFFVEYDNTQNDANHIHSVWRDLENDFGQDLLHLHYQEHHHTG